MVQLYKVQFIRKLLLTFVVSFLFACTGQSTTITSHISHTSHTSHTETEDHPPDLWQRLRNGFALEALENNEIKRNEASYTKDPELLYRIIERSERYLFYIVEEIERREMPTEIALLPLVESAFNPHAISSVNAAGLWQFIPTTGKSFGLHQDRWLDERQDVIAATHAALDYLQSLHNKFDDWQLALAAYNWGQGSVSRALEKNRKEGLPEDFHSINLPIETRNHIHKLIAIKNIVADPEDYGIELNIIPNQPYFKEIDAHQHIDKTLAAELADISLEELDALNPAHKRAIIKVTNPPQALLLPVENADKFLENLENHEEPLMSWHIHQVQRGENINKISRRYRMTENQLKEANGITKQSNRITHGQTILVPHASNRIDANTSIVRKKPSLARYAKNLSIYIVVKKGDTLSGIAKRHGTTIQQIKRWNTNNKQIFVGQKLKLQLTKS